MGSSERYGTIALLVAMLAAALAGCGSSGGGTALPLPALKTFVTASAFDGNLIAVTGKANGVLAADALCMKDAQYP
ncbi:MAG TPA: hypothetical protein VFG28_04995, partial [Syntrophales bacterium]|nr:hypothetical protein [Syntrophales bacterium]